MDWIFILALPTLAATFWAFYVKIKEKNIEDFKILFALWIFVTVNVTIVYQMILGDISIASQIVQMVAGASVVPLLYLYFARQVGTLSFNKPALIAMWALIPLSFIPNILVYNPFEPLVYPDTELKPFLIYILSNGEKVACFGTGDMVVVIQLIITISRIIPFMLLLRAHNLHLNRKVYVFGLCWMVTIMFIFMISSMSLEDLRSTAGMRFYFGMSGLLSICINVLIALHYDSYPIETEHGEVVENLDAYMKNQFGALATSMKHLIKEKNLLSDSQLSSERMIELLHTNRTYFSQMMNHEFRMTFSEYVNQRRLEHVMQCLDDENLSLADIAARCGFNDSSYMSRKFKERYNVTPTTWRKNKKAENQ